MRGLVESPVALLLAALQQTPGHVRGDRGGLPLAQAAFAHIIDLGPGAGHDDDRLVFEGRPADLVAARSTLTAQHLSAYVGV